MATVADELLNDFGDSDSDNENEDENEDDNNEFAVHGDGHEDGVTGEAGYGLGKTDMELDDDEEAPDDEDDESAPAHLKAEADEDAEETKARVEKMELKAVADVKTVAGLMKKLEPLLEVSMIHPKHIPIPNPHTPLYPPQQSDQFE
jgi:U4/U6 small nuclear ribonucleoprotein PRP31